MSQKSSTTNGRFRPLIIGGAVTAVLLTIAAGVWYFRQNNQGDGTFNNPTVQTTTTTGSTVGDALAGIGRSDVAAKLSLRLSQGQAQPDAALMNPLVTGDPLTADEINQILARLPELTGEAGDEQPFNLPDALLPPPQPGRTVDQTFPPPPADVAAPEVTTGPLEVLRYTPEGDVGLAPFINITFNQPMVPLTSLETLAAADVPVRVTPELPGSWQWISPQTLRFEAQADAVDRMPMATEFVVEVPAGTQSASGNTLAETVRWTFSTPPVQLVSSYPSDFEPQPLEPLIFFAFDQLIEQTAVFSTLQVTADSTPQAVRLATEAEIAADDQVSQLVKNARDGYWLVVRPQSAFPPASSIQVTVPAGTPSAEGPRTTTATQSFSFRTYPPLRITRSLCNWSDGSCPPLTPFIIEFSNPLDPAAFSDSQIRIEPALPGATVQLNYNSLTIQGISKGRTTYRVTVDGGLKDVFGQTLGEAETVRFDVSTAVPFLSGSSDILITTDPSAAGFGK